MNENKTNALIRQRALGLREKRKSLLNRPAEQAVETILNDERPAELVHSFPEEDLYLLIKDIGAEDALPVISLASTKQWDYMLDMEVWENDRLDMHAATRWMDLLLAADAGRLARWCADEKMEFIEFFLFRNIEFSVREEKQDPSDFGKEYFTFDDSFYIRVLALPLATVSDEEPDAARQNQDYNRNRKLFFQNLLQKFAGHNYQDYRHLLLESASVIPAETEEELYRLRNTRLAEKGFLPREEAVGIYQPIKPPDLPARQPKHVEKESEDLPLPPAPLSTGILLEAGTHFARALAAVDRTRLQMQLQSEFAGLCNSIIVADRETIQTREALGRVVKKACGYIDIGLENLSGGHRHLIQTYPLSDIFRVGYGKALALKWKAEKWQKRSWYSQAGLRLNFWDEILMGVIGGLLVLKPLFFDNYASGVIYREFQSGDDILKTEDALDRAICLDGLFSRMDIGDLPETDRSLLTYKNLLLTLWADHCRGLGQPDRSVTAGIPLSEFQAFFSTLWESETAPARIKSSRKASFLEWLSQSGGLVEDEVPHPLGRAFESLFREIEKELGGVSVQDLNPRYVRLFLVAP